MSSFTFVVALFVLAAALSIAMTGAWIVHRRTGNSGWIDTVWTFGLGAIGVASALVPVDSTEGQTTRQMLVAGFVLLWSLRLGVHIARRTLGIDDDPRYAELIRQWGRNAPGRMFLLVQEQALLSLPLALSIFLAAHNPVPMWRPQDYLAVAVMIVALVGEAVADRQLRRFKADPANRGRVCDAGLWRWSRHPNYFFEWLAWLAYPLLAIDLSGAYPWGWLALIGPICMYWLLAYVSGLPPLEAHMLRSRGEAYRAYQARTSTFFPAPPRGEKTRS